MDRPKAKILREEADREGVVAVLLPYAAECQVSIPIPQSLWETEITELQLSVRSSNGLMRAGLRTVGLVCDCIMSDRGLASLRNVGKKSIAEIKAAILTEAYARLDSSGKDAFWMRFVRENLGVIEQRNSKCSI